MSSVLFRQVNEFTTPSIDDNIEIRVGTTKGSSKSQQTGLSGKGRGSVLGCTSVLCGQRPVVGTVVVV